jgi:flagellar biosynthetic protein FliR
MYAFLMVFLRASALLLSSPVFGAQTTPITIRILTTASISAALTFVVKHSFGPVPASIYDLAGVAVHEVLAGFLIGSFMSLALQVGQLAGGLMDLQVGLSMSQIMNPITGVQVTVLAQYKFLLGVVLFLLCDAHHIVIQAFVKSYDAMPGLSITTLPELQNGLIHLVTAVSLLSIQIASPVMAIGLLLDGTFGLINRAVPQIQITSVGLPAKLGLGLVAVSFGLPAMTVGVVSAVNQAVISLGPMFQK